MRMLDIENKVEIKDVHIDGEHFFMLSDCNAMRPFFMSIVSNSNHWMFISSNGGISAGRKDSENALFPYYTDDKITESAEITGSKTILRIKKDDGFQLWEPFSEKYFGMQDISRNLYKSALGNKILFEEVNHDLNLTYRYQWSTSDDFGFVRTSSLINNAPSPVHVTILDGIQNIMPYGVGSYLQNQTSNLVDAYKRSELHKSTGLGIYALSAIIVDKAEPSEALKANVVWSAGLNAPKYLLSSLQLNNFRMGKDLIEETDVKAERGAYFISSDVNLAPDQKQDWMIVADVNKNHSAVARLMERIGNGNKILEDVILDVKNGSQQLKKLIASADGLQLTADKLKDTRHYSNVLFNIMRGGIFDNNYKIEKSDFIKFLQNANKSASEYGKGQLKILHDEFDLKSLMEIVGKSDNSDFIRLSMEYLPLKFSRRHGDPSRPWNRFSINTKNEDGSKVLDYEGNWRDIFQNWEALSLSYPEFVSGMIFKFLNASTFDGYNPYRVTKGGFDWETIEPDDPWSYIGYWGDHQIIYLLKLLEIWESHSPGESSRYFNQDLFVYANVPYRIKPYQEILKNPKDTIDFDHHLDLEIRSKVNEIGADGALLTDTNDGIYKVNFIEKILASVLAKLSNYIPGGGIWMNTQRPEWNDANNALVGNGVSMVTLYYLRRFLVFFEGVLKKYKGSSINISSELLSFYNGILNTFLTNKNLLSSSMSDADRKAILDGVGEAASKFRHLIYAESFSGDKRELEVGELQQFISLALQFLEYSIPLNKREDNLYHAYNIMTINGEEGISISYLSEMLEGQVAVLSSGLLNSKEGLAVLDALKASKLFREDQYSYLLYPNKELPSFLNKNIIPKEAVKSSPLLQQLISDGNTSIIDEDINGNFHFNGNFKNAGDLLKGLNALNETRYSNVLTSDKTKVLQIFESIFDHKSFTGRSGTFYGYEGLGSIYWHMVSKLHVAVQEICLKAIEDQQNPEIIGRLLEHYYEIGEGIGVHKSPALYGAFPTDPYSHTPAGKGAQQPGMTGQVKEDILVRFGELGVFVDEGRLLFEPCLLKAGEFLEEETTFEYYDISGNKKLLQLEKGSLAFTYCQVPVVYVKSDHSGMKVIFKNFSSKLYDEHHLDEALSQKIFDRNGEVIQIIVHIDSKSLR